jgi:hypothetical protein
VQEVRGLEGTPRTPPLVRVSAAGKLRLADCLMASAPWQLTSYICRRSGKRLCFRPPRPHFFLRLCGLLFLVRKVLIHLLRAVPKLRYQTRNLSYVPRLPVDSQKTVPTGLDRIVSDRARCRIQPQTIRRERPLPAVQKSNHDLLGTAQCRISFCGRIHPSGKTGQIQASLCAKLIIVWVLPHRHNISYLIYKSLL